MKHALLLLVLGFSFVSSAQQRLDDLPMHWQVSEAVQANFIETDTFRHTAFRPYTRGLLLLDSLQTYFTKDMRYFTLAGLKTFGDHLITVKQDDFELFIDPILDLELGFDLSDSTAYADTVQLYNNTRGLRLAGRIGEKVSFQTALFENQSFLPLYLKNYADSLGVIPGQGRWKLFETVGYDYSASTGKFAVQISDRFDASIGHGKMFIGNGYRSMLLSDFAFNAAYLRADYHSLDKKWLFSKVHFEMNGLNRLPLGEVPESLLEKKALGVHYLSFAPNKKIELGLYEAVVWQRFDSADGSQTLPWNAFTPVPLLNTAVLGLNDDRHNVLLGANAHIKWNKGIQSYAQFIVDDLKNEEYGLQAGLRFRNIFKGLHAQIEYNKASEGVYGHQIGLQNYSHNNDPLAHPLGNDFEELVVIVHHEWKRWWSRYQLNYQHLNRSNSVPNAIDGIPLNTVQERWIGEVQLGYTMNPKLRWQCLMGFRYRSGHQSSGVNETSYLYFGMRTAIVNKYNDF